MCMRPTFGRRVRTVVVLFSTPSLLSLQPSAGHIELERSLPNIDDSRASFGVDRSSVGSDLRSVEVKMTTLVSKATVIVAFVRGVWGGFAV